MAEYCVWTYDAYIESNEVTDTDLWFRITPPKQGTLEIGYLAVYHNCSVAKNIQIQFSDSTILSFAKLFDGDWNPNEWLHLPNDHLLGTFKCTQMRDEFVANPDYLGFLIEDMEPKTSAKSVHIVIRGLLSNYGLPTTSFYEAGIYADGQVKTLNHSKIIAMRTR